MPPRRRFHPAIAWLCLIWFGLTSTVFAGGLVVCHDGAGENGGLRIEWGCSKNTDGECVVSCGSDPDRDPGVPHPCEDTPIPGQEQITKAPPRSAGDTSVPAPVLVAVLGGVLGGWADLPLAAQVAWMASEPDRPPDILRHIRTVVLLV